MPGIVVDIIFCAVVYGVLLTVILMKHNKGRRNNDSDGDDDGGLPVSLPPDIDLPPGVCLPDDPSRLKTREPEEVYA